MLSSHRQPEQLELFPTAVRLTKVVPECNQWRFYLMQTTPTLFGEWSLVREWGRIGSPGHVRLETHDNMGGAIQALVETHRAKERRGYRLSLPDHRSRSDPGRLPRTLRDGAVSRPGVEATTIAPCGARATHQLI
jgi:predicted DNA-binding WGR domain protein